jgi:tRNA (guanine-N7-)-methyltransferase
MLLNSSTLPWPADWREIFGCSAPIILDIGFGYGHTLHHLSAQHPDANIIGLEIDHTCLVRAEKALARGQLPNVHVVRSRAETALHHLFTPASLNQVHINFPDPWFKSKHSGRRLMQRDTLDAIVSRLEPDGLFFLATDIFDYAEMSAELLAHTPGLTNQLDTAWTNSLPDRAVTKYEQKARAAGRACYYFAYRRNHQPAPHIAVIEELPMPHVILRSPLNLDEMMDQFSPEPAYAQDDLRVKFIDVFRNEISLLFEVYVHDPTIEQRIAVILAQRQGAGEYILKLSSLGLPRSTAGVHYAVGVLGDYLVSLHPDATLLERRIRSGV